MDEKRVFINLRVSDSMKQKKTKYLQIQLSEQLKKRFDEALKKTNLSATHVVLPFLFRNIS